MPDDLWWPCPECSETVRERVRWSDPQVTWLREDDGSTHTRRYSMAFACDACGKTGRMVYSAR